MCLIFLIYNEFNERKKEVVGKHKICQLDVKVTGMLMTFPVFFPYHVILSAWVQLIFTKPYDVCAVILVYI